MPTHLCLVFGELAHAGLVGGADVGGRLLRLPQRLLARVLLHVLRHLLLVLFRPVQVECRGVAVERVCGVGVSEELWEETLKDVGEVVERRPRLVDHVQAHRAGHLVDVRVVHLRTKCTVDLFYFDGMIIA